jgi:hypothetical protein
VKISEEQREKLIKARQHGLSLRVRQGGIRNPAGLWAQVSARPAR